MSTATTTADPGSSSAAAAAQSTTHTYHCICTQLVFATTTWLNRLPTRASTDKSHICTLASTSETEDEKSTSPHYATLTNTTLDANPTVIRLDDGFEKRYFETCARCDLIVGYHLDKSQYEGSKTDKGCRDDVVYLIPGGLMTTDEMKSGKKMDADIGKVAAMT
ncbi:hypothetical protein AAFC00_002478 [Neodothiora populina]|uniref:STEEP1 domain-containing protein n=1 Tax=Neodothiora populina TaxID=2781224 RepID=A0ABR3P7M5_9PEZI